MSRLVQRGHRIVAVTGRFPGATQEEELMGVKVIRIGTPETLLPRIMSKYLRSRDLKDFDVIVETAIFGIPFFTPLYTSKPTVLILWHLPRATLITELQEKWGRVIGTLTGILAVGLEDTFAPLVYRNVPIFTFSRSTKKDLVDTGFDENRIFAVDYALSDGIMTMGMNGSFKPLTRTDKDPVAPRFVCLGRLKKYKGVQDALQAFRIIIDRWPSAQMAIVGRGDYEPKLRRLTQKLGISESVKFMGHVSLEEKVKLLQSAHALVMPSYKEGFATPIIEANLCGTIAVASDAVGVAELVKDQETGLIYSCGDWRELAGKMCQILERPELRANMESQIYRRASEISIPKREEEFVNLFDDYLQDLVSLRLRANEAT
jgi:glycosyltransferase involved in cell wall biosynthesis